MAEGEVVVKVQSEPLQRCFSWHRMRDSESGPGIPSLTLSRSWRPFELSLLGTDITQDPYMAV